MVYISPQVLELVSDLLGTKAVNNMKSNQSALTTRRMDTVDELSAMAILF